MQVGMGILMECVSSFGNWGERGQIQLPDTHRMNFPWKEERVVLPEELLDRQTQQMILKDA